ncbi:MAG: YgcG family protein [Bradyrhizobium sp.]|uniref:TPM domain-containing protein n=1 Tax=Bradyrhizobium sp. TaxID=376 RepID=UPI001C283D71|nr:YgcG family protein [Bradyrhizobium sp.]MBU6465065.1 YgcG family protein [Pseudomonadota bacterium]MDE2068489.1 YgcG family protein [Bradyrhizobium sp.]MDE2242218.1 YgcG family protein [Bradyrhizobium sp.]MDE2471212.1 YgcG family protein [Bradyrhizobium sp.]
MNVARASLVALLLCWAFAFGQMAAFAQVPVPPLSGPVVDQTGTLSSDEIASLTQKIRDFEARKGSQIAVLIVPTTQPEEIEQYSIRVAEAWKIGRKKIDDGAILLVAKNDRKLRIEVGYGLEGALTDVTSERIIDEIITPKFRNGDFAGGISAGVDRIIGVINGEPLPPPPKRSQRSNTSISPEFFNPTNPFVIIGVLFLGSLMRSMLGRLIGSAVAGGVVALLVWYFLGSLIFAVIAFVAVGLFTMISDGFHSSMPYVGGGGWSSSGRSGGGWSSGSAGGSFSGGGGSFGGGGASGSW